MRSIKSRVIQWNDETKKIYNGLIGILKAVNLIKDEDTSYVKEMILDERQEIDGFVNAVLKKIENIGSTFLDQELLLGATGRQLDSHSITHLNETGAKIYDAYQLEWIKELKSLFKSCEIVEELIKDKEIYIFQIYLHCAMELLKKDSSLPLDLKREVWLRVIQDFSDFLMNKWEDLALEMDFIIIIQKMTIKWIPIFKLIIHHMDIINLFEDTITKNLEYLQKIENHIIRNLITVMVIQKNNHSINIPSDFQKDWKSDFTEEMLKITLEQCESELISKIPSQKADFQDRLNESIIYVGFFDGSNMQYRDLNLVTMGILTKKESIRQQRICLGLNNDSIRAWYRLLNFTKAIHGFISHIGTIREKLGWSPLLLNMLEVVNIDNLLAYHRNILHNIVDIRNENQEISRTNLGIELRRYNMQIPALNQVVLPKFTQLTDEELIQYIKSECINDGYKLIQYGELLNCHVLSPSIRQEFDERLNTSISKTLFTEQGDSWPFLEKKEGLSSGPNDIPGIVKTISLSESLKKEEKVNHQKTIHVISEQCKSSIIYATGIFESKKGIEHIGFFYEEHSSAKKDFFHIFGLDKEIVFNKILTRLDNDEDLQSFIENESKKNTDLKTYVKQCYLTGNQKISYVIGQKNLFHYIVEMKKISVNIWKRNALSQLEIIDSIGNGSSRIKMNILCEGGSERHDSFIQLSLTNNQFRQDKTQLKKILCSAINNSALSDEDKENIFTYFIVPRPSVSEMGFATVLYQIESDRKLSVFDRCVKAAFVFTYEMLIKDFSRYDPLSILDSNLTNIIALKMKSILYDFIYVEAIKFFNNEQSIKNNVCSALSLENKSYLLINRKNESNTIFGQFYLVHEYYVIIDDEGNVQFKKEYLSKLSESENYNIWASDYFGSIEKKLVNLFLKDLPNDNLTLTYYFDSLKEKYVPQLINETRDKLDEIIALKIARESKWVQISKNPRLKSTFAPFEDLAISVNESLNEFDQTALFIAIQCNNKRLIDFFMNQGINGSLVGNAEDKKQLNPQYYSNSNPMLFSNPAQIYQRNNYLLGSRCKARLK